MLVLAASVVFRVPFPVQPLKAMTALAVAQGLSADTIHAAGLEIGGSSWRSRQPPGRRRLGRGYRTEVAHETAWLIAFAHGTRGEYLLRAIPRGTP